MRAIPGRIYALVQDDRAHQIFTIDELPEWSASLNVIDVTDLDPQPAAGWIYDQGQFFPDPGPAPDGYHTLDPATHVWVPLDPAVADVLREARAQAEIDAKIMRTVFEVLFGLVNDVRVLKGQQPITREQLKAQMVTFYKSLG